MKKTIAILAVAALVAPAALGDWDPGDGYKMANDPQLPDPNGWDIHAEGFFMADDWLCSETGPVSDIHFWYSKHGDVGDLYGGTIQIFSDDPDPDGEGPEFSHPKLPVWTDWFGPGSLDFSTRLYGVGDQGWYDLVSGTYEENDHTEIWQCNIVDIPDPFIQQEGTVYWLGIHLEAVDEADELGWKTSLNHWNDDAARWHYNEWLELRDPITDESLDMAFVITPEPTTMGVLALSGLAVLRRRRRL